MCGNVRIFPGMQKYGSLMCFNSVLATMEVLITEEYDISGSDTHNSCSTAHMYCNLPRNHKKYPNQNELNASIKDELQFKLIS